MVDEKKMEKTHIAVTAMYALLDVTICLYLSPNNRPRSLSTLIAVSVKKDAVHKIPAVAKFISCA